ncbi:hypothetical protein FV139_09070 [Parahaliea maris]|uniref:Uncharacterized protein n=1 Tax=Parahaliea maris TaxID=2716870 RepID=A0A5C9A132_9GAMM|nr:hypothetical protein FV139_09070 [Parahaliea maris]
MVPGTFSGPSAAWMPLKSPQGRVHGVSRKGSGCRMRGFKTHRPWSRRFLKMLYTINLLERQQRRRLFPVAIDVLPLFPGEICHR